VVEGAPARVLVAGVGNVLRRDDGAGIEVVRRLRAAGAPTGVELHAEEGEPVGLLDRFAGRDAVVLVDTMRSGAPAGTVRRVDATEEALPIALTGSTSTHAIGLGQAVELARTLGRLPARVVVYAVEGARFDAGGELSDPVAAAVPALVDAVGVEAAALVS
jgi:hydrogenase maturation protease